MQNGEGEEANSFEDLGKLELEHFGDVYKEDRKATIVEVVKMTTFFPSFVNDMSNESLMEEVAKEDLRVVLHSFQKHKSPRPDGWPAEFFLGFCDLIEDGLIKVIEESRVNGKIFGAFKSNFKSLIPKSANPSSFEEFRPISLCNCIYKIIAKIIARRVKALLSDTVSQ